MDERDASRGLDPLHGREDVHYSGVSDGTKAVIYEPMELMERLAALVPPPRFNITRFYGVLAPASTIRPLIVPHVETSITPTHSGCPAKTGISKTDSVLAPASTIRPLIVPEDKTTIAPTHSDCPAKTGTLKTDFSKTKAKRGVQPRNYSWAQLMMRIFEVDVLACPRCGGRMRVLCAINSPTAIEKILACLGLPTRPPPIEPAVSDEDEFCQYQ